MQCQIKVEFEGRNGKQSIEVFLASLLNAKTFLELKINRMFILEHEHHRNI